jgi:hypothetical protein
MKNIHILPTEKPSILYAKDDNYKLANSTMAMDWYISSAGYKPYNIYITSDEEIKEGDWCLPFFNGIVDTVTDQQEVYKVKNGDSYYEDKKIILTTDQDLIKDGVQAIDDEFLEWFVKNPSCEEVEVKWVKTPDGIFYHKDNVPYGYYKVIIPQEESKLTNTINKDELGIPKGSLTELIGVNKQETLEGLISEYHSIAYEKLVKGLTEQETTADYIDRHIVEAMVEVAKQKMYSEEEVIEILNEFSIACYSPIEKFEIPEWFEKYKKK